jgi:hypothetical protein
MINCGRRIDLEDKNDGDEDDVDTMYSNVVNNANEVEELFATDYQILTSDQSSKCFQDISSSVLGEKELRRYLVHSKPILVKPKAMQSFICSNVSQWRGHEGPGDTNSALARAFYRLQSDTWSRIVDCHYEAVLSASIAFVHAVIKVVVPQVVRPGVVQYIIEPALRGLQQRFKSKCTEIVEGFQQIDPTQFVSYIDPKSINNEVGEILQSFQTQHRQEPQNDEPPTGLDNGPDRIRIMSGIKSWVLATHCRRVRLYMQKYRLGRN